MDCWDKLDADQATLDLAKAPRDEKKADMSKRQPSSKETKAYTATVASNKALAAATPLLPLQPPSAEARRSQTIDQGRTFLVFWQKLSKVSAPVNLPYTVTIGLLLRMYSVSRRSPSQSKHRSISVFVAACTTNKSHSHSVPRHGDRREISRQQLQVTVT